MTKGVLLFAHNNEIDYIKQAIYCAKHIKKHLNLPVALVTDTPDHLIKYPNHNIDFIINVPKLPVFQKKTFYDGTYTNKKLTWNNIGRADCFHLTPFDETIVMDTDLLLGNNQLLECFASDEDLLISKQHCDLNTFRNIHQLTKVSDTSIDMYWATVFYFKKTELTETFFNLVNHIKDNWEFYRYNYDIVGINFRNDFAFSIALHILKGFDSVISWPNELPAKIWYTIDKDVLIKNQSSLLFLLNDETYFPAKITNANVHVMNKFSLDRIIDND